MTTGDRQKAALELIQRQLKELDQIVKETSASLNTVRGTEKVEQWKKQTVPLLAQQIGQAEAQRFADTHPGPSFTSDLFEEFTDRADTYRTALEALAKELTKSS